MSAAYASLDDELAGTPTPEAPTISVIKLSAADPLAKRVWATRSESGAVELHKEVSGLQATQYEVIRLPTEDWERRFAKVVVELEPASCLLHAHLKKERPDFGLIRSKAKVAAMLPEIAAQLIARSNEFVEYPAAPGIMLIDADEPVAAEQCVARLSAVVPAFKDTSWVAYSSTSAHIYTTTGEELRGATGLHLAVAVADASDIQRAGKALAARLALAGDYRPFISQAGVFELRTLVDLMMLRPAQPEFASGCFIDSKRSTVALVQRRPAPLVHQGTAQLLDTRAAIPNLTADEREQYKKLKAQQQREHAGEIEERRKECQTRIARHIGTKTNDEQRATRVARDALTEKLVPPFAIQANDGTDVPVLDILNSPHDFESRGWSLRDPLEPEYGAAKAKVFVADDGSVKVRSFAHGGRDFLLGHDDASAIERLKELGGDAVDHWFAELRQHFVGTPAQMEAVFDFLKRERKVTLDALRRQEKEWSRSHAGAGERVLDAEDVDIAESVRDDVYGGDKRITFADDQTLKGFDKCWQTLPDHHVEAECLRVAIDRREERVLAAKARGSAPPQFGCTVTAMAATATKTLKRLQTQKLDFSRDRASNPLLNFQNGTLDLSTGELREHRPEDALLYCAPINYDPTATSPAFSELLNLIWPEMPEVHRHFEEVLGYAIQSERFLKVVVVAWGSGFNGKTPLFYKLPLAVLGSDAVGPMSLHLFNDDKFASADPVGKLVLVEDDLRIGTLWPDGPLKKLSERSVLRAEVKHQQAFSFVNLSVPFVLGNTVARVRDGSPATSERIQAFKFERSFPPSGGAAPYDHATAERLFDAVLGAELPGVVNRLVAGFQRVKARCGRGGFDVPVECKQWRDEYLRQGNQLLQFLDERTVSSSAETVDASALFDLYQDWCHATGRPGETLLGRNTFYDRLREAGLAVREGHGRSLTVYGLTVKPEREQTKSAGEAA